MAFWDRWFGKAPDTGPIVRIILHTEPFDFTGIDRFTILDGPVTAAKKIPFGLQPVREWSEPYDPKRHVVMDGRVPDTIHRFTRPAGPPIDFLIKNGIIIQVTESARGRGTETGPEFPPSSFTAPPDPIIPEDDRPAATPSGAVQSAFFPARPWYAGRAAASVGVRGADGAGNGAGGGAGRRRLAGREYARGSQDGRPARPLREMQRPR